MLRARSAQRTAQPSRGADSSEVVSYIKAPSGGMWILAGVTCALPGALRRCVSLAEGLCRGAGPAVGSGPCAIPRAARAGRALPHGPAGLALRGDQTRQGIHFRNGEILQKGALKPQVSRVVWSQAVRPHHCQGIWSLSPSPAPQAQPPHSSSKRVLGIAKLLLNSRKNK